MHETIIFILSIIAVVTCGVIGIRIYDKWAEKRAREKAAKWEEAAK